MPTVSKQVIIPSLDVKCLQLVKIKFESTKWKLLSSNRVHFLPPMGAFATLFCIIHFPPPPKVREKGPKYVTDKGFIVMPRYQVINIWVFFGGGDGSGHLYFLLEGKILSLEVWNQSQNVFQQLPKECLKNRKRNNYWTPLIKASVYTKYQK